MGETALRIMLWIEIGLITFLQIVEIFSNPWAEKHLEEDKLIVYRTIWKAVWVVMIAYSLILIGFALNKVGI